MKPSPLVSIFLIVFVDVMGLTIILPLLPFYAQRMGASAIQVGLLFSSYAVCQLFAGPVLGMISDRIGRRPVLLISQFGTCAAFLMLAFSNKLWMVFAARIIDGITAGNLSVAQAYIADVTLPENRAKSFGLIGVAFGLGFLLGPVISAFLSQWGYQCPFFFAAFLSALSIAGTFFLLPESRSREERSQSEASWLPWKAYAATFRNRDVAPLLWQFWAFIFAFVLFISGFALFLERRFIWKGEPMGAAEVGYLFAYAGLIGLIIQGGLIGRLARAFGEKKLVRYGFIFMTAGTLMLGFSHTLFFLFPAITIAFLGSSLLRPSLTSLISQRIGKSQQGMVLGLTQSLMSISQITAPFFGGLLIEHRHLSMWAWAGAAITSAGFLLSRSETQP